jgi:prephenate dehydrogenase
VFTPDTARSKQAAKKLARLVKRFGAKPVLMNPKEHDEILAAISHLPNLLAYSLLHAASEVQKGRALKFSGSSFRDITRVASSSAEMWTDIGLDNSEQILRMIGRQEKVLLKLKGLLRRGDAQGLQKFFAMAAQLRRKL